MSGKLRMGMVGGGVDAFSGAVHRTAVRLNGQAELVCGAFGSTAPRSKESGAALGIDPDRIYGNYREMFRKEKKLSEDERMQFVVITTPNNMHYPITMAAFDNGFHVVCEAPMTTSLDEARNLVRKLGDSDRLFCLTHTYTGYPMVKQARELVTKGRLGEIRRVVAEYPQGWLSSRAETSGNKQAMWRTDAKRAGLACCMADNGAHCASLVEYVTGLEIESVCSDLNTFVRGRPLDDDGSVLLRFNNEARGVIWASQVAAGEENALSIRVYGEDGGLEWRQQDPDTLVVRWLSKATELQRKGTEFVGKTAAAASRLPQGRPEGYLEGLANIYATYIPALQKAVEGKSVKAAGYDFPGAEHGLRVMAFVAAVVASSTSKDKWVPVEA